MTQRTALLIAAGLTAFFLIAVGGLSAYLLQLQAAPGLASTSSPAPIVAELVPAGSGGEAAGPTLSPDQAAVYQQALQEARARLEEANARLAAANDQIRLAQEQAAPPTALPAPPPTAPAADPAPPTAPPADPAPPLLISPDRAALVALSVAPNATLSGMPDLVSYKGRTAYEVVLDRGSVYVDAVSGRILYNGVAPAPAAAPPAVGRTDGAEHESEGDD